jgi:uncharacterized Zn-binding protein involved in type VI secretion
MGMPAAKMGDGVVGTDTHIVLMPSAAGPVPTPTPMPFNGLLTEQCSENVLIGGLGAATVGSIAVNEPPHVPTPSGVFANPPTNQATVLSGSPTVLINDKPAARAGDEALTCNDPVPAPVGVVKAEGTVLIGP